MTAIYADTGAAWKNLRTGVLDDSTPTVRFPGDPGVGNYYVGWAAGPTTTGNLTYGKSVTPKFGLFHTYAGQASLNASMIDQAITAKVMPSHTFKMAVSPASIVAGNADATIDSMASACASRDPYPIWLCYYHEPEDNHTTTQQQSDYRAAYRRIVQRFRTAGVTNVAWQPIIMNPWTFQSGSGRDWRNWHADWTGTGWQSDIMMDIMGLDTYNPQVGDTTSMTFDGIFSLMKAKVELAGYPRWPYTMPEFGFGFAQIDWAAWCTNARNYMKSNNIIAASYWQQFDDGQFQLGPEDPQYGSARSKQTGWNVIANAAKTFVAPA